MPMPDTRGKSKGELSSSTMDDLKQYFDQKFTNLMGEITVIRTDVQSVKSELESFKGEIRTLSVRIDQSEGKIFDLEQIMDTLQAGKKKAEEDWTEFQHHVANIDAYQRRSNLIFFGVEEEEEHEKADVKLRTFMTNHLGIPEKKASNVEFELVHRLGRLDRTKTRPIIARFLRYNDVRLTKSYAYKRPKGSKGGVTEDIPPLETRADKADDAFKEAKSQKKRVRWYGSRLFVEGKEWQPD